MSISSCLITEEFDFNSTSKIIGESILDSHTALEDATSKFKHDKAYENMMMDLNGIKWKLIYTQVLLKVVLVKFVQKDAQHCAKEILLLIR